MYTVQWALNFTGFAEEEQMDLHKFVLFYDQHIAEKLFTYTTSNKVLSSFVVETKQNQLPHLIGLRHWNNLPVKQSSKQYEYLLNGEWDMSYLEKADNGSFRQYGERIEFLPNIYNFLYNYDCTIKLVNKNVKSSFTNRRIDMIFQKQGVKRVYVLELREKSPKIQPGLFVLTSITVHNPKSNALQGNYTPLNITSVTVI